MKTRIYLVRHTETVGNIEDRFVGRTDFDITKRGEKYIDELTERLEDIKFDKAYSSTSSRTRKTIQKLAKLNHLKIEEKEQLCEMNFGDYDGKKWKDIDKINPEVRKTRDLINEITHIPHQESTQEVTERMVKTMHSIAKNNVGKTILVCSHGVAIESFLRNVSGEGFTVRQNEYGQRNTAINIVEYDNSNDKFRILVLNDYSHILNP
ncbi:MAG: histidine phosphatase family protein [Clostridia bacterium]|nr:histidine phosphatase family protein [Clostridia bacterium]